MLAGRLRFVAAMPAVVVAAAPAAFGRHHAGLGLDLDLGVDLEVALRDHKFAFLQSVTNELVIARSRAQDDLATLERRLLRLGKLLTQSGHRGFDLGERLFGLMRSTGALPAQCVLAEPVRAGIPETFGVVGSRLVIRAVQHRPVGCQSLPDLLEVALFNNRR